MYPTNCRTVRTNTTFPSLLVADVLVSERCKYKAIAEEMDQTFADLAGY